MKPLRKEFAPFVHASLFIAAGGCLTGIEDRLDTSNKNLSSVDARLKQVACEISEVRRNLDSLTYQLDVRANGAGPAVASGTTQSNRRLSDLVERTTEAIEGIRDAAKALQRMSETISIAGALLMLQNQLVPTEYSFTIEYRPLRVVDDLPSTREWADTYGPILAAIYKNESAAKFWKSRLDAYACLFDKFPNTGQLAKTRGFSTYGDKLADGEILAAYADICLPSALPTTPSDQGTDYQWNSEKAQAINEALYWCSQPWFVCEYKPTDAEREHLGVIIAGLMEWTEGYGKDLKIRFIQQGSQITVVDVDSGCYKDQLRNAGDASESSCDSASDEKQVSWEFVFTLDPLCQAPQRQLSDIIAGEPITIPIQQRYSIESSPSNSKRKFTRIEKSFELHLNMQWDQTGKIQWVGSVCSGKHKLATVSAVGDVQRRLDPPR